MLSWINLSSALRKKQQRLEQYSRRNKIEVIDIPTNIPENELARKFEIYRESVLVENSNKSHSCQGHRVTAYVCNETKAITWR